jgi:hypothetical protein
VRQRLSRRGWSGIACASPDRGREAIMQTKWVLEIYDSRRKISLISMHEFDDFPSLKTKILENRDCKYRIEPPDHATPNEFQCLLDLRGKGFKLERK